MQRKDIYLLKTNRVKVKKAPYPYIRTTDNNVNTYIKVVKLDRDAPVPSNGLVKGEPWFWEQYVTFL